MTRTIRVVESADALAVAAGETFIACAADAIRTRGRFAVALSGGSTPRRLYELLGREPFRSRIEWPHVDLWWGDERTVPPDHAESNYRMVREALLDHLDLDPAQVHRIAAERPDRDAAAWAYQAELARAFAASDGHPPRLDLVLLGMGADGHTLSLFPHTPAVREQARWVMPNAGRITLTPPLVNRAAQLLFLVSGADKASVLVEVLEGPADPDRLPAQTVAPVDGRLTWLVDRAAAARLRPETIAGA